MGYGKPMDNGQGVGHKNLAGSLKWRDCAGRIPDWDPADGVPISIAALLRQSDPSEGRFPSHAKHIHPLPTPSRQSSRTRMHPLQLSATATRLTFRGRSRLVPFRLPAVGYRRKETSPYPSMLSRFRCQMSSFSRRQQLVRLLPTRTNVRHSSQATTCSRPRLKSLVRCPSRHLTSQKHSPMSKFPATTPFVFAISITSPEPLSRRFARKKANRLSRLRRASERTPS